MNTAEARAGIKAATAEGRTASLFGANLEGAIIAPGWIAAAQKQEARRDH